MRGRTRAVMQRSPDAANRRDSLRYRACLRRLLELALEMRDRIAVRAGPEAAQRARVLLLYSAVEVGARALGDRWICLEDGATIACDVVVLCTGLRAAPFIAKIKGGKDRFGRLLADAYLRALDSPNVFVAGDAVCARPEQGRETRMSCQHALMLGRFAGEATFSGCRSCLIPNLAM